MVTKYTPATYEHKCDGCGCLAPPGYSRFNAVPGDWVKVKIIDPISGYVNRDDDDVDYSREWDLCRTCAEGASIYIRSFVDEVLRKSLREQE